jgi:hypothetical protein
MPLRQDVQVFWPTPADLPASDAFKPLPSYPPTWFGKEVAENDPTHFTKYNNYSEGMVQDQQQHLYFYAVHGSDQERKVYVG